MKSDKLLSEINKILEDKKAENIVCVDMRDKEYLVDFVVIATALVDKHSFSLLDSLKADLKAQGAEFYATDEENGDWIIADIGAEDASVMVHIFTQNHRDKFNLEEFLVKFKKLA